MPDDSRMTGEQGKVASAMADADAVVTGIVIAISKGFAEVRVGERTLLCTMRGKLRRRVPPATERRGPPANARGGKGRSPQPPGAPAPTENAPPPRVTPGDRVRVRPLGGADGVIEELLPRRSELARSAGEAGGAQIMLANLDHAALVFAVRDPVPHFGMLDRYLALCERAGVAVTIVLNKIDLGDTPEIARACALYEGLGYPVLRTSVVSGKQVAELRARVAGRVSLLTGPSGVGKSSLINALLPDAALRTSDVSAATGKGRHTTTGARLLALPGGGWLADSAGIRELALWNVPAAELADCFVELRGRVDDCLYEDCAHSAGEEGCALRAALVVGAITPARYASFERLLREARGEVDAAS
ncbi:MAG TPA: ribosome small subunit-dependent GTPase A [Ktedonobacterales bacterium]|nr:ribosome small subunit-dependent GTPase A [Ktedonobacterales bacterium]